MLRNEKTTRSSLIFATVVAFCSVCTAGVSTYAWFQASSSVNVTASPSSTTITVSKPEDYTFYAYNKNASATYSSPNGTFSNDFVAITSENKAALTSSSSLNPGQSMVFCLKMTAATPGFPITLKIKELVSNTADKQGLSYNRYVAINNDDVAINIGWAIDIYVLASSDGTGYSDFLIKNKDSETGALSDLFDYSQSARGELNASGTGSSPDKVIDLDTDIVLYDSDAVTATTYLFYRVYFSDLETTYYKETGSPDGDNVEVLTADRRFTYVGDSTGTSNCYGGLKFQLVTMELKF